MGQMGAQGAGCGRSWQQASAYAHRMSVAVDRVERSQQYRLDLLLLVLVLDLVVVLVELLLFALVPVGGPTSTSTVLRYGCNYWLVLYYY